MISGINHVTLSVKDLERSFNFYVGILALKPVARWLRGAYLLAGDAWLCLSLDPATRETCLPEYTHLALTVSESHLKDLEASLLASGHMPWKANQSEGDSYYFLDPDGHKLELHAGNLQTRLDALRETPYEGLVLYSVQDSADSVSASLGASPQ